MRLSRALFFGGVSSFIAIAASCGGDATGSATISSTLAASPASLSFSDTGLIRSLFLTTAPSGGRLEWQVVSKPSWVTVEPMSGIVTGMVTVKLSAAGLATSEPGTLSGRLELVSSGGTASITLSAVVTADPIATPSSSIAVAATVDTSSFTITNSGRGPLSWQLVSPPAWLTVSPSSGILPTGQKATVKITVDKSSLPVGTVPVSLTLRSNARSGDVAVPVSVVVPASPRIAASTGRLAYPAGVTTRSFTISNPGKGPLTWSVGSKDAWLSLSPSSGTVAPGSSETVTAVVARANVPGGQAAGTLTLTSNAVNGSATLAVDVTNTAPLDLGVRVLDHRVVDAEFSAASGLIVTVSTSPSRLNAIDVETGATWSVALPLAPTSVSLRPDGAFAAVGHDGQVSYVNLQSRTLVRTYPVTADALDVVLASNGFVYIFPRRDQWTSIFAIDLATGVQSQGVTIYAGTVGRLHPSGDYIYGANNGLSPSDFEKYDIRKGTPSMLYDSPYHGDYAFSGDVWISSDGTRLFARSGNVFRSSPVRAEDMLYAGKLAGVSGVRWLADIAARNRIYVLASAGTDPFTPARSPNITLFDSGFLSPLGTVALPKMTGAAGASVDIDGYYLFPSGDGSRLYVLIKAVASAGLSQDWALAVIDASRLP